MANSFAYNIIPPSGSALIAQATAANPVVFVESLSCTLAAESDDDLASKNKAWYTGKTGQIQAVSATDNRAHIVCRYSNAGSEQVAKSIAVTAKLANQADSEAVILCAKSDPDSDARLPGSEQIGQFVEFGFTIQIDGSSTVTATPGASATIADLDRFVSMHSATDNGLGDEQTILGTKTFTDDVIFRGILYGDSNIRVASTICPEDDADCSLGAEGKRFEDAYISNVIANSVNVDDLYSNYNSNIKLYSPLIPGNNNAYALGDSTHAFSVIYTQNINTEVLGTAQASGVIGLVSDIAPYSGADVKIGTSTAPIPEGNFTTMKAGNTMTSNLSSPSTNINLRNPLIPYDNTASLGTTTDGFYDLYLADQPGGGNVYNPPRPFTASGNLYIRHGAIMLVYIARTDTTTEKVIKAGSYIQVGDLGIGAVTPARMVSSGVVSPGTSGVVNWSFSSESLDDYLFAALCDIVIPANEIGGIGLVVCLGGV